MDKMLRCWYLTAAFPVHWVPRLAREFTTRVHESALHKTYEVFLNENSTLRWRGLGNDKEIILTEEPQAGFWNRFVGGFMRVLPIRSQL